MNKLKANYKSKNIEIGYNKQYSATTPKIHYILSNYVIKCNIAKCVYGICNKKNNLVIPNSVKYINLQIIEYYNFETVNNLKCAGQNGKNEIIHEYFLTHNSKQKYICHCDTRNIIFLHSFYNRHGGKLKNIFLFENLCYFILDRNNVKPYNSKNIVIFKNVKKIMLTVLPYRIKSIMMFRNIHNVYFGCCGEIKMTISRNVNILCFGHGYPLLKKNKPMVNNVLVIYFFRECDDNALKCNFTYITKLVIFNDKFVIKNNFTVGTTRILGMRNHKKSLIGRSLMKTSNETLIKYVDYIFLF